MEKHRSVQRKIREPNDFISEMSSARPREPSPAETAQYLAQMVSELVTLARTARLERLSLLLDFVAREAETEAESSAV